MAKLMIVVDVTGLSEREVSDLVVAMSVQVEGTKAEGRKVDATVAGFTIRWKCESTNPFCGPVWIDGARQPKWMTGAEARDLAKNLGATFEEV